MRPGISGHGAKSHVVKSSTPSTWAITLAGGDGSRLRPLTRDSRGEPVPKQFCAVGGGGSMLRRTLDRIAPLVDPDRQLVSVTHAHRSWWTRELCDHPIENIVVQPRNRGTASGILMPLVELRRRDPGACVVVLPSDHHVEDETVLMEAVAAALDASRRDPDRLVLIGMTPEGPDFDYGFIMPLQGAAGSHAVRPVRAFVEKPPLGLAFALRAQGALWNSFIMAGRAGALLSMFEEAVPWLVDGHRAVLGHGPQDLRSLYDQLPPCDFSRSVLERCVPRLAVLTVRPCGWCDMGTPERVLRCFPSVRVPLGASEAGLAAGGCHGDRSRLRYDTAEDQRLAQ